MRQEFICEHCGVESHVNLPRGLDEDALVVLEMIAAEHKKWSPECEAPAETVKKLKALIVEGEWPHTLNAGVLN